MFYMKKALCLLVVLTLLIMPFSVSAAGNVSLRASVNKAAVTVGDNITVSVGFGAAMGAFTVTVLYDASLVDYSSVNLGAASNGSGSVTTVWQDPAGGSGAKNSVVFTFKSKKAGKITFSISGDGFADATAIEYDSVSPSSVSVTINAKTAVTSSVKPSSAPPVSSEESKSDNANLQSLTVENFQLTPDFDPLVTEYGVNVPSHVENLDIIAIPAFEKAMVEISGGKELKEGENPVTITVTAEDGVASKIYLLKILRAEAESSSEIETVIPSQPENPTSFWKTVDSAVIRWRYAVIGFLLLVIVILVILIITAGVRNGSGGGKYSAKNRKMNDNEWR